jgi:hypothetical protein
LIQKTSKEAAIRRLREIEEEITALPDLDHFPEGPDGIIIQSERDLGSRGFAVSTHWHRHTARYTQPQADEKLPTLMSSQNRRKPKVTNFTDDLKTYSSRGKSYQL